MNKNNDVAISYLKAFITVLVVAHHAFLAYANFVPLPAKSFVYESGLWAGFPVVDSERWKGFDLIILFNDTFFMALMFFIAGLFVWQSLTRKGPRHYLRDRLVRLGIPFLAVSGLIMPIAYYPSYLLTDSAPGTLPYFQQLLSLDFWPSGPCWFIGALLIFDLLAALAYQFIPSGINALGRLCASAGQRPSMFFLVLVGASIAASLPMLTAFGTLHWFKLGPFAIQASRILLYLTWFFAGVIVGAGDRTQGLLATAGKLPKRWAWWAGFALVAFAVRVVLSVLIQKAGAAAVHSLHWLANLAFNFTCCAISFFFLAVFLRFANRRSAVWNSLSENAYGIYLLHYPFVIWTQYSLLPISLPPVEKGLAAFVLSLLLSWGATAGIRFIPGIDRVLSSGRSAVRRSVIGQHSPTG